MPHSPRLPAAFVHVYTGNGKGKTTAALGLGLRAAGHGLRVFLLQFMKGDPEYGELRALASLPNIEFQQSGLPTFVTKGNPGPEDVRLARAGLARARELLAAEEHDLVILDELICAVDYGLVPEADVLALLDARPPHMELVLTGRNATPAIIDKADLVTEMQEIKHPFQNGILARKGIEH